MFYNKSKFVPYYLILEYDRIILKKFLIITFFITKNEVPHEFCPDKWYLHMQNNTLSSSIKNSLLLWLHDKSCLSQQKNILKWTGLIFHLSLYNKLIEHYIASWGYKMLKINFTQSFAVLTHEIYFNGHRDILYLCLAMKHPQFSRKRKSLQASRKVPLHALNSHYIKHTTIKIDTCF